MVEFYLILSAVTKVSGGVFWRLMIGTLVMLIAGYLGEAGTVGALAATTNAICNALAPAGVRHLDMPATPLRVWEALRDAGYGPAVR